MTMSVQNKNPPAIGPRGDVCAELTCDKPGETLETTSPATRSQSLLLHLVRIAQWQSVWMWPRRQGFDSLPHPKSYPAGSHLPWGDSLWIEGGSSLVGAGIDPKPTLERWAAFTQENWRV